MPNLNLQVRHSQAEPWHTLNTEMYLDQITFGVAWDCLMTKRNGWSMDYHGFPNAQFRIISDKRLEEEAERLALHADQKHHLSPSD